MTSIPVTGERPYEVQVGRGIATEIGAHIDPRSTKVLIIHAPSTAAIATEIREVLAEHFDQVLLAEVPDAEGAKRVEVAAFCWQIMGQAAFTRTDSIVGIGGGATTDLAGFVAATWLRGVDVIQVPTTVLGMVDASIGGKTGINTNEGKNLVGTFTPPRAVVCDLALLETLPENELKAGFAEVVKCGFIRDPQILHELAHDLHSSLDPTSETCRDLIERSIRVKADVVAADFREGGVREILNYGHTLGHAIEHQERYQWRHGAAISIGMVYAAELGRIAGSLSDEIVDQHRALLEAIGLPTTYPEGRWEGLLAAMQRDKKARAGMLRFIVLDDLARPRVLAGADHAMLRLAYQEISR